MKQEIFQTYIEALVKNLKTGDSSERTHYSALEDFIERMGKDLGHDCDAVIEPKNQVRGIPDFYVLDSRGRLIGHIEVKDVGLSLIEVEKTEQLKSYLQEGTYPNLILTDYTDWWLYKNGERVNQVHFADPDQLKAGVAASFANEDLHNLLRDFISVRTAQIRSPKVLAERLAEKARVLRDNVIKFELEAEKDSQLESIFHTFREYLLPDMDTKQFADLYAQTLTYGLFVARLHAPEEKFNRDSAERFVPASIPLLRAVFSYLSGAQTPASVIRLVDEIVDLLIATKVPDLVGSLKHTKKTDDPIVYFYEDFMAEYDPAERELRGQYYTPAQVVSYMVRSVHQILKDKFNKPLGLADSSVHILDPATGTATFPAEIIQTALREDEKQGQSGSTQQIVDQILQNMSAFELMMGSYVVGHLKIDVLLRELKLKMNYPFRLYLTNTLNNKELQPSFAPMATELSHETHEAQKVKNEEGVLVIIGNPPYSGHSSNNSKWITKLMRGEDISTNSKTDNYFEVDGVSLSQLGERNPKWLNDDYVKFIRFAQWKIEQVGEGILAYITNHAWVDNPTFRGMRQSLLKAFDEIYIYDLHGSTKNKETTPDGGKDENVFDIQQGVAISIFIKHADKSKVVKHSDLFGLRGIKYETLLDNSYKSTSWAPLNPKSPGYLLSPAREDSEYDSWPSIQDIFQVSSVGIVTARDRLTIGFSEIEIQQRISQFSALDAEQARTVFNLGDDVRDWKVHWAQEDLRQTNLSPNNIKKIDYRPLDSRFTYYTGKLKGFICMPRKEVMRHLIGGNNIALVSTRQISGDKFEHALVASSIVESTYISNRTREIGYVFPLRPEEAGAIAASGGQVSNLKSSFLDSIRGQAPKTTDEAAFAYIYGILYTPAYRSKYNEFLRRDFPRIPWPKDQKQFDEISQLGQDLIDLHLMKASVKSLGSFEGNGNSVVEKIVYHEGGPELTRTKWTRSPEPATVYGKNSVSINNVQYFKGISRNVWEYRIGGYQVLDKWLKSRKDKFLSPDDVTYFRKIAAILAETIKIQEKLDQAWRS